MFIRLTRTDGRPIWINPEFVVTVEDRKGGGSIVVPAGDGLDYDVKESPDAVMRMCAGGMPQSAVEQPTAGSAGQQPPEPQQPAAQEQPATEPTDVLPLQDAPAVPVDQAEATVQALREKVKRLRKATEAENPEASTAEKPGGKPTEEDAKPKPAAKPRKKASRKKPAIDLTDEQMARLRKMAPGSRQKLLNTLVHLKVPNAEATAVALIANKVLEILPDNHVNWLAK